MTLRAVKERLAVELANLTVPTIIAETQPLPAVVLTAPPTVDILDAPRLWLWAQDSTEQRLGGPRVGGIGTKQVSYQCQIAAMWTFDPATSDPLQFDDLLDAILARVGAISLPQQLTDSQTGATSTLLKIGEEFTVRREPPTALQQQGLLLYVAVVETAVWELVQR